MSTRSTRNVHLLVLIHGMWGSPSNLASMHRIIEETRIQESSVDPDGTTLHVMLAETNQAESTYDGIDWGGERVATEASHIFQEIERLEEQGDKVTRFSVTGYSLGGLLARYVVGILNQRKFFVTVTPVNFNTIATPHIGLLTYPSFLSRLGSLLGPRLLSRTGEQFYGVDKWSNTGKSLLEVMADPGKEPFVYQRVFFQGLKLFPHIRIYANAVNDLTVPFMTAHVDLDDPFLNHDAHELIVDYDDEYFPVIKSFTVADTPSLKHKTVRLFTWEWFKSYNPPLPPRFQPSFPFNIISLALLPIIFPAFISLAILRLSIASHHSRSRIKLLESEDTSATERLVHIFGQLEHKVENIVVDIVDNSSAISYQENTKTPRVTAAQRKMVAVLNSLPQLKKERAYIPNVRNSHAAIIARDVKNFEFHKIGEGVLRHWADAFVM
ncbi:putative serine esterase-domain-containing protein [Russula earlei]|uniref:Serine esterase-domain-containing protein n=1 Tax=Russula earlei TaxID=71964 RepID=A0ACC0UJK3_9AGAM|nr:putative serine esterase-domain-containing protein [Russula earlei]